jgi:hypothetical protein
VSTQGGGSKKVEENAYMAKPPDPRAFERLLRTIAEFWDLGETPDFDWSKNPATSNCQGGRP